MIILTLRRVVLSSMLLIIALVTNLNAQTGSIEGTVRVNDPAGPKPVANAVVDIYRTDIKGKWSVKTDKTGHYVMLGLQLTGHYTLIISGPGIAPAYRTGVRITLTPVVDLVADPGNGQTLTLEQVQQFQKGAPGSARPGAPAPSAEDKAKAEAAQKDIERQRKESEALQASFDEARNHYNAGIELTKANPPNYSAALSEFEQATSVDPGKHAAMLMLSYRANANLAEVHYQLGVELFNEKKRDQAKPHFEKAVAAANKAITEAAKDTVENNPNLNNDVLIYHNILSKNAILLVQHFGAEKLVDPTAASLDKAATLDTTNKNKWGVAKGDLYFAAGRSADATAAYRAVLASDPANIDALYGLGLTLIAGTEKAQIQEGANTLADFVSKAPQTDKRVPIVKEALEGVKEAYKVEAEKPARRGRRP